MRRLVILLTAILTMPVLASGALGAPAAHASTAAVPADTAPIAQSGTAQGSQKIANEPAELTESGDYTTTGQLGHGSYFIKADSPDLACHGPTTIITVTGTASLLRMDGAWLHGTAVIDELCPSTEASYVRITLTLGMPDHDLVSAHLVLLGTHSSTLQYPGEFLYATGYAISGDATFTQTVGYRMVDANGNVTGFGGLAALGNARTTGVTHLESTPDELGYWIVDDGGRVFAFGDAAWLGNAPPLPVGETVTNLSATPSGHGYWLFTTRGRALPFGDAPFLGDLSRVALNGPVIGAVGTPTGRGYDMVASDGGVFSFGDARFFGSMGAAHLNRPVNGLVPTADNNGYWLVASDGGVFSFGDAVFHGSMGAVPLNRPVVGMTRYGRGYVMVGSDGGVFTFTSSPFYGSLGATPGPVPVVGISAAG